MYPAQIFSDDSTFLMKNLLDLIKNGLLDSKTTNHIMWLELRSKEKLINGKTRCFGMLKPIIV